MSWMPDKDPELGDKKSCDALELAIVPRVRDLGDSARVELDAELLPLPPDLEEDVLAAARVAGFDEAEVAGFRSGSMNDPLR